MGDSNGNTEKTPVVKESDQEPILDELTKKSAKNDLHTQSENSDNTKQADSNKLADSKGENNSNTASSKTEAVTSDDPMSEELCKKILKQLEYYFGDVNLPRDRFLQEQIKADDGWVKIETLLTFNRLKKICDDSTLIAKAVKKSTSKILEMSECLTKVRRSPQKPIPENTKERRTEINARSVYAKGFPLDCGIDELEEFFQKFGAVDTIFMRRLPKEKTFKGSVFVTFASKDDSDKFLKTEGLKHKDTDENELKKMLKEDYFTMKQQQKQQLKNNDEAKKQEEEKTREEEKKKLLDRITKGAILNLEGVGDDTSREDIRNYFSDFGQVAWVDFDSGDKKARLRFDVEKGAALALEKAKEANDGQIEINNAVLVAHVLEGDEEIEHWQSIFNKKHQGRNKKRTQPYNKGKRKFNHGGHGKKFDRRDEPHEKRSKAD